MTDGFVNIWVEKIGRSFHAIVETGDGKRTISPPFRTERAANFRAEKALEAICKLHPEADITRDQRSGTQPAETAPEQHAACDARHEEPRA